MMPNKLPTNLHTFEANDTVSRAAQNENIKVIDALFHPSSGHRHSGEPGDAPPIGSGGLATGAVIAAKIASGAVISEKLAAASVTSDKLAAFAVMNSNLGLGAVSADKLAEASVTGSRIAPASVNAGHIVDGAVTENKLAPASITSSKLTNGAITADKVAENAITSVKVADNAVTANKLANNSVDRRHLRGGGLGSNIAKFKPVSVTGGNLTGSPTVHYAADGENQWSINRMVQLPQFLTINLGKTYHGIEGMSFGTANGADAAQAPRGFYIEASLNNGTWTRVYTHPGGGYTPFTYLPFIGAASAAYIRLVITERSEGDITSVSAIAVYSSYYGAIEQEALNDTRPWGLNARLQGMMVIPQGDITDDGNGYIYINNTIAVVNAAAGMKFTIYGGGYHLPSWGYLYVDIPTAIPSAWNNVTANLAVGEYPLSVKQYDNPNRLIIAQRGEDGYAYFNCALPARVAGTRMNADSVNGIEFRSYYNQYLEYKHGSGWQMLENKYGAGFAAMLSSDKQTITNDGADTMTITVTLSDEQGQIQSAFNEEVQLEMNGMTQAVKLTEGVGTITVSSEEPGEFVLRTVGFERNSQMKVVITDGEKA